MPAANALNYLALQDAVLGRRFPPATQRPNAKRWLASAYADVWAAADWTFKRVSRASLATTPGDSTPTMPSDFGDAIQLLDDVGNEIPRLSQEEFEERFASALIQNQSGPPEAYMVVNRQIEIAPLPTGATLKLSYWRSLSHKESDGTTVTAGFMDEDDDYPLWDDHHAILIPRATAIGLMELNDPTGEPQMAEFERQLSRMKLDYEQVRPAQQWGRM